MVCVGGFASGGRAPSARLGPDAGRYVLARKLAEQIAAIRRTVRQGVFQQCLFGPQARPGVSYERGFAFRDGMFADVRRYTGNLTFNRHFLGQDNLPAFDGKAGGEENVRLRARWPAGRQAETLGAQCGPAP
jgi:hypothetical protein